MQSLNITLVGGLPGAGKTTWIQQLSATDGKGVYLCPERTASIDATYLNAEIPSLSAITDESSIDSLVGRPVYVELRFYLDHASIGLSIAEITRNRRN